MQNFRRILFLLILFPICSFAQISPTGLFKTFERVAVATTVLRLNSDSTYSIIRKNISCSLCDTKEESDFAKNSGRWTINKDTLYLTDKKAVNKLLIENQETLKPLYIPDFDLRGLKQAVLDSLKRRYKLYGPKYYLSTDTHKTGEIKKIYAPYDYSGKKNGLEVSMGKTGRIFKIERFRKGKFIKDINFQ